ARLEAREGVFGCRGGQVVPDRPLVLQELAGHHRADGVAAQVVRAGAAGPVAEPPRERVEPAGLEHAPEDVSLRHQNITTTRAPTAKAYTANGTSPALRITASMSEIAR